MCVWMIVSVQVFTGVDWWRVECMCLDDSLSTSLHRGGLVASGVCVWMIVSVQVFTGVDWWRVECVCG